MKKWMLLILVCTCANSWASREQSFNNKLIDTAIFSADNTPPRQENNSSDSDSGSSYSEGEHDFEIGTHQTIQPDINNNNNNNNNIDPENDCDYLEKRIRIAEADLRQYIYEGHKKIYSEYDALENTVRACYKAMKHFQDTFNNIHSENATRFESLEELMKQYVVRFSTGDKGDPTGRLNAFLQNSQIALQKTNELIKQNEIHEKCIAMNATAIENKHSCECSQTIKKLKKEITQLHKSFTPYKEEFEFNKAAWLHQNEVNMTIYYILKKSTLPNETLSELEHILFQGSNIEQNMLPPASTSTIIFSNSESDDDSRRGSHIDQNSFASVDTKNIDNNNNATSNRLADFFDNN